LHIFSPNFSRFVPPLYTSIHLYFSRFVPPPAWRGVERREAGLGEAWRGSNVCAAAQRWRSGREVKKWRERVAFYS